MNFASTMIDGFEWIKTEQMLENLRRDSDNEHQYALWLGGMLQTTHWLEFESSTKMFVDSMDWSDFCRYTETEFLEIYTGRWWKRER